MKLDLLVPGVIFILVVRDYYLSIHRQASSVLEDLSENNDCFDMQQPNVTSDRISQGRKAKVAAGIFAFCLTAARSLYSTSELLSMIFTAVISYCFVLLLYRVLQRNQAEKRLRQLEFYLPIAMERLVMAVESGFDIISAVKRVSEQEAESQKEDPVSRLLRKVIDFHETGFSFEDSLQLVAESSDSIALRHAFVHLGMAFKEGGELIYPLRELSDSALLHYQEKVEEEIAKLPVKATLPLVVSFAGLIICFLTPPLLHVIGIASKAAPG